MTMQPGEILASKYRIDGVLGVGGMGTVLAATHLELEHRVAIKLPHAAQVADATVAARFLREGKNAARIRSAHVARVLDVGRNDAGIPFLVMEYLEGHDLSKHLKAMGRMAVPDAVDILLQACDAVSAAHAVGIVHRDLKPANLFLEQRNDGTFHVKVLDFGISKLLVEDPVALEAALTSTTGVIGSPMYMSPEQMVAARSVDPRADVWSLGLILFKCLTGKTPWPSGNVMELAARIAKDAPLTPRSLVPDIPEALEAAILACLEKDREQRTASPLDFAVAIAPFDPDRGEHLVRQIRATASTRMTTSSGMVAIAAPKPTAPSAAGDAIEPYTGTAPTSLPRPGARARRIVVAAVVAAAALVCVIALFRAPSRESSREPAAASSTTSAPIVTATTPLPPLPDPARPPTVPASVAASASASAAASPASSAMPAAKASARPTAMTSTKSKAPDPWGSW